MPGSSTRRWRMYPMLGLTVCVLMTATAARAHFGAIIPSDDIVTQSDSRQLDLQVMFFHPFEGHYMNMDKPAQFGVLVQGRKQDLLSVLQGKEVEGFSAWRAQYKIRRPGDHLFYVEPSPYFEPAEGSFIIHYTKVVVGALGMEDAWNAEVGLKTEIIPLTRPYGLWTGNVFQGQVKLKGQPLPHAEVEVEYYNTDGVNAPDDSFITQVVTADQSGVFTYAMPRAGWWGFAALSTDEQKLRHTDGVEYEVEIGAVLWVKTHDMK